MKLRELEQIAAVVSLDADIPLDAAIDLLLSAAVRAGVIARTASDRPGGHSSACPCDRCKWLREAGIAWENPQGALETGPRARLVDLLHRVARRIGGATE